MNNPNNVFNPGKYLEYPALAASSARFAYEDGGSNFVKNVWSEHSVLIQA
jgi:hypothetical protein